MGAIYEIGALCALEDALTGINFTKLNHYVGVSAGGFIAAGLANGFVALEDTKRLFGSQNIVPLVRADRADEVKEALNAVSAALTTEAIAEMLKKTDIDKADPKTVAQEFLTTNSLG